VRIEKTKRNVVKLCQLKFFLLKVKCSFEMEVLNSKFVLIKVCPFEKKVFNREISKEYFYYMLYKMKNGNFSCLNNLTCEFFKTICITIDVDCFMI
jgi:hypothetical protein